MATESVRSVRNNFSDVIGRVQQHHERVTITKNGAASAAAAVLISPEDLDSMEETLTILSEPGARAELAEAEQSILDGDVVAGADAIAALRQR
jgi:antitoxin YefM